MLSTGGRFGSVPREPYNRGSTLVPGLLIPEDPNTVVHVYFTVADNFAGSGTPVQLIWDTKGNSWTRNGTIPYAVSDTSAVTPGGVPVGSATNFWNCTTAALAGFSTDYCVTLVGVPGNVTATAALVGKDNAGATTGWASTLTAAGALANISRGGGTVTTTNSVVNGQPFVASFGRYSTTTGFAKLNLGPLATGAQVVAANATDYLGIGRTAASAGTDTSTYIMEVHISAAAPGQASVATVDAALNLRHAAILDAMGIGYNNSMPVNGMGTI